MEEDDIPMGQSGPVSTSPPTPKKEQVKTGSRVKPLPGSPPKADRLPPVAEGFPVQMQSYVPPVSLGSRPPPQRLSAWRALEASVRRLDAHPRQGGTKRKKITKRKKHTKKQNGRRRK